MGVRILYNSDTWDAGTITSSSEVTGLEDDNAVQGFVGKPWRATGDSSEYWRVDLGSATNLTCFGIFGHNFTSSATVKLQANTSNSFGSPPFDQTLTIATDSDGVVLPRLVFFLNQTYRWWNIDVADASNPDGYLEAGRIIAGQHWEPTRTITDGFNMRRRDLSAGERTPGVGWYKRERKRARTANVGFELFDRAQHEKFDTVFTKVGDSGHLVLSIDPTNYPSKDSMYGTIGSDLGTVFTEASLHDTPNLTFVEEVE